MNADPLQLFWPQNCGCYVINYFESTSSAINIKKETHGQLLKNDNDANIATLWLNKQMLYHIKYGFYFGHFSIF